MESWGGPGERRSCSPFDLQCWGAEGSGSQAGAFVGDTLLDLWCSCGCTPSSLKSESLYRDVQTKNGKSLTTDSFVPYKAFSGFALSEHCTGRSHKIEYPVPLLYKGIIKAKRNCCAVRKCVGRKWKVRSLESLFSQLPPVSWVELRQCIEFGAKGFENLH
eukprot:1343952-Rhodomonas_salina.1